MKRITIITGMLILALTVSAQSNNRSRVKQEKKEPATSVKRTENSNRSSATRKSSASSDQNRRTVRQPNNSQRSVRTSKSTPGSSRSVNKSERTNRNSSFETNRSAERRVTSPKTNSGRVIPGNSERERSTNINRSSGHSRSANSVRGSYYDPKNSSSHTAKRKVYTTPARKRVVRSTPTVKYIPRPIEYRRRHYYYRTPARVEIFWNTGLYNYYSRLYPHYDLWYYPIGHRLNSIPAYHADSYIGEITRVYGRVVDVWYARETDEYYLYFGDIYPYQDFSIILEGRDARRFNRRPDRFFKDRYITATGLISLYEGKPEMVIKQRKQLALY